MHDSLATFIMRYSARTSQDKIRKDSIHTLVGVISTFQTLPPLGLTSTTKFILLLLFCSGTPDFHGRIPTSAFNQVWYTGFTRVKTHA